jgi:branched-chain amino acid transport system substrate-binding protein
MILKLINLRILSVGRISALALSLFLPPSYINADTAKPTIGVVAPLSGQLATYGKAIRNGIDLARANHPELINAVDFHFEDDQHDPKRSLTAYRNIASQTQPGALMVFGFFFPTVMGREIATKKIPLINLSFFAKPAIGNPYIIRSMNHTGQYARALADFLAKENQSEYPFIRAQYEFYLRLSEDTDARLREIKPGTKLSLMAEVLPNEQDFRAIILKLKASTPKRVGLFLFPGQLPSFMRQARESNLNFEIFGSPACETAATIDGARQLIEGCVYPDNDVASDFRESYRSRYGDETQLTFAGAAYDMSLLLGDYFRRHPGSSSKDVLAALEAVQGRSGVLGSFTFKDDPAFGKYYSYPIVTKRISNGVGVVVKQ